MSHRLFKVNGAYLVAQDLLAVVTHLVHESRRPGEGGRVPCGLYGQKALTIEDLGEVKTIGENL